ncbi:MAG: bifunctional diaminohydroxyphosphoribosylaminopyrimidine deaminase/5-amino-6-(5-phosphoribosylamino)uracil reductase RibD [Thiotrichales bacterium]|nr:bifunctional diaminohydroxyphosphoribosylaminopyrimidine deaminase/5-amino-6-(5-phosphoribosylamino)uracil reductase RibD [Thiotrichales bacterium]MBT3614171.1 bifunctional diaminohydroxyphosphoribosylaminopyrimidine deaminase/5-amino-6-(5-phosphoribosylamino)uracil reductase RibD [Thiotrichales bacterium]MBT3751989.1 bifunctional diaminohydroxyphosphoribosylaminopyrimidine deaminase/5-amino-6-(5-phosphoribosylamino)uracil reductase RibD [Thiotrichales bacterium]MBT3837372.1 bifunctional diam
MARAHTLAAKALYTTDPNPRVGCVIVKDNVVIGEGLHRRAGGAHAEIDALRMAAESGNSTVNATVFVTLEPCSHTGRTPPCCDALIAAGVKRVVVALEDPNPEVSGKGVKRLKDAKIEVISGVQEDKSETLNSGFMMRMRKQRPFIRIKMAQSLDGRTAMSSGESKWITGIESRQDVQRMRARSSAILTGSGTIVADNPSLNVREIEDDYIAPLRVVLDPDGKTPLDAKIFGTEGDVLMVVAEECHPPLWKMGEHNNNLLDTIKLARVDGGVDLNKLMNILADREINEVQVEAGATLTGALIKADLVDEIVTYIAPVLMGSGARPLFDLKIDNMSDKIEMKITSVESFGDDIKVVSEIISS